MGARIPIVVNFINICFYFPIGFLYFLLLKYCPLSIACAACNVVYGSVKHVTCVHFQLILSVSFTLRTPSSTSDRKYNNCPSSPYFAGDSYRFCFFFVSSDNFLRLYVGFNPSHVQLCSGNNTNQLLHSTEEIERKREIVHNLLTFKFLPILFFRCCMLLLLSESGWVGFFFLLFCMYEQWNWFENSIVL